MITIFQINLSDQEIDAVNAGEEAPRWNARRDALMGYKWLEEKGIMESVQQYYRPALVVDTDDLEEAFALTNLWDQLDRVERLERGGSTSVGDIAVEDNGRVSICDNFGWKTLEAA